MNAALAHRIVRFSTNAPDAAGDRTDQGDAAALTRFQLWHGGTNEIDRPKHVDAENLLRLLVPTLISPLRKRADGRAVDQRIEVAEPIDECFDRGLVRNIQRRRLMPLAGCLVDRRLVEIGCSDPCAKG